MCTDFGFTPLCHQLHFLTFYMTVSVPLLHEHLYISVFPAYQKKYYFIYCTAMVIVFLLYLLTPQFFLAKNSWQDLSRPPHLLLIYILIVPNLNR